MSQQPLWFVQAMAFAGHLSRRFVEDRGLAAAASLSYTSLLALVPLIAIGFAVLAAFPAFDAMQQDIQKFIFKYIVPSAVEAAEGYLIEFIAKARGLKAVGVVGLIVTALLLFTTIETAFNLIFRVTEPRPLILRLLAFWAMLSLGPMLIGASFSVGTELFADAAGVVLLSGLIDALAPVLPTILSTVAFAFLYVVMPNRPVRIRDALIGAAIAALAFTVLRWGFTVYVTRFPSHQNLYGTLATIPIFLFWMYLSWSVVLAGAVITATLPDWGRATVTPAKAASPRRRLRVALAVLKALYRRAQSGGGLRENELLRAVDAGEAELTDNLAALRQAALIDRNGEDLWFAVRDPAAVSLSELILALDLDLEAGPPGATAAPAWPTPAVADLVAAESRRRRQALSVPLRDLLVTPAGDEATSLPSPLRLDRTP